ncbi:MAG TPA: hypothetical protein V6C72_09920, partial [Chroococcales cyanobacterium]
MNNGMDFIAGCSEEFAELCALSTSGELNAEEMETLERHVSGCAPCRALLQEYSSLASIGMAKLAAAHKPEAEPVPGYYDMQAEDRFISALHAAQSARRPKAQSRLHVAATPKNQNAGKRLAMLMAAACFLLCVGGGIEIGRKIEDRSHRPTPSVAVLNKTVTSDSKKTRLEMELKEAKTSLDTITAKSVDLERNLNELTSTKESLLAQLESLTRKDNADAASLSAITQQRDELQQQLNAAMASLVQAKEELNQSQQDRQGALDRVATLEANINDLHSELAVANRSSG